MKTLVVFAWALLAAGAAAHGQEMLDRLDDALTFSAWHDNARAHFSGLADAEAYYFQHPAPGLVDSTNRFLLNPRLTLFLDTQLESAVLLLRASPAGPRV